VWCATVQANVVTTNEAAWREIEGWRGQIEAWRAADVVAQLDVVMRGPVQWRAPVLSGGGWAYPWGYFALSTYAQAYRRLSSPCALPRAGKCVHLSAHRCAAGTRRRRILALAHRHRPTVRRVEPFVRRAVVFAAGAQRAFDE